MSQIFVLNCCKISCKKKRIFLFEISVDKDNYYFINIGHGLNFKKISEMLSF